MECFKGSKPLLNALNFFFSLYTNPIQYKSRYYIYSIIYIPSQKKNSDNLNP